MRLLIVSSEGASMTRYVGDFIRQIAVCGDGPRSVRFVLEGIIPESEKKLFIETDT
jgi:hypothetical protein